PRSHQFLPAALSSADPTLPPPAAGPPAPTPAAPSRSCPRRRPSLTPPPAAALPTADARRLAAVDPSRRRRRPCRRISPSPPVYPPFDPADGVRSASPLHGRILPCECTWDLGPHSIPSLDPACSPVSSPPRSGTPSVARSPCCNVPQELLAASCPLPRLDLAHGGAPSRRSTAGSRTDPVRADASGGFSSEIELEP
ncbi:unnamed protein product, partial [Urochloa humidicola]